MILVVDSDIEICPGCSNLDCRTLGCISREQNLLGEDSQFKAKPDSETPIEKLKDWYDREGRLRYGVGK